MSYKKMKMKPMKISRTKVDLYCQCPRCFYFEVKLGVKRPPGLPFTINSAVDRLFKTEFDGYRENGTQHPLQRSLGPEVIPFADPRMTQWRANTKGVQYHHPSHDTLYYGSIDDLWIDLSTGQCFAVDYKATAKKEAVTQLPDWADSYRRQMEFYQWLLRKNGIDCSELGYFVYANGDAYAPTFNNQLLFRTELIAYKGDDSWVEPTLEALQSCLTAPLIPAAAADCKWCAYQTQTKSI
jgi:hypothetical protein